MESIRLTVVLWLLVIVTAFAIIKSSHQSRVYFIEWQSLIKKSQVHDVEWGQLLIEKGILASYLGLENVAKDQLKMSFPLRQQIVIVSGEGK
jgi:cell division protein FtsL